MADEVDAVRLPVDIAVDENPFQDVIASAERADQAVKNLTQSVRQLNQERTSRQQQQTQANAQPENEQERWVTQRNTRQRRRAFEQDLSTPEERFATYQQQLARAQERQQFAKILGTTYGTQEGASSYASTGSLLGLASGNAGMAAGGILGDLRGMLGNPYLDAGLFGGAAVLGINSAITEQQATQQTLGSAIGGQYNPQALNQSLIGAANLYGFSAGTAQQTAQQLGQLGVQSSDVNNNTGRVLQLAALTGQQPSQLAPMIGAMSVGGGMSGQDINQSLGELYQQSLGSKVALDSLIESLKTLQIATGGVAMDWRSMGQLAAAQKALGPGINVGAMVAPGMQATGINEISTAASLGISTDQLAQIQGRRGGTANPAALLSLQFNRLAQMSAGLSGEDRIALEQQLAPQLGLSLQGSATQQDRYLALGNSGQLQAAIAAFNGQAPSTRLPAPLPNRNPQSILTQLRNRVGNTVDTIANNPTEQGVNTAFNTAALPGWLQAIGGFGDTVMGALGLGAAQQAPAASGPGSSASSPLHIQVEVTGKLNADGTATITPKTSRIQVNRQVKGQVSYTTTTPRG